MSSALLDPERQFLACLMQLPTTPTRRLLAGMRADDLASPVAAHVLQLAIEVLAEDRAPAPLALLDRARETTDTRPRSGGEHRLHDLGAWIIDTHQHAPVASPFEYGAWLKTLVLKAAWRRAIREHGQRLVQAVDDDWSTQSLREITDQTDRIDDLWNRYQAAHRPDSTTARLEVAA